MAQSRINNRKHTEVQPNRRIGQNSLLSRTTSDRKSFHGRVIVATNPCRQCFKPSARIDDPIPTDRSMLVGKNASDAFRVVRPYGEQHPVGGGFVIVELMSRGLS